VAQRIASKHFAFDDWSRRSSPLHHLSPLAKLLTALALLITTSVWPQAWFLYPLAAALTLLARLPLPAVLWRAALVLPFTLLFAALTAWMGDPHRALALLWKSHLSAWWVALLMATTPLHQVLAAAGRLGAPRLVLDVMHFTWRYLGVISEQAARMRTAALARGAEKSFSVSAATLASLFTGSYARAERIHRAMLARGAGGPQ
jgi:cobalt/nickel transport system permease protein